MTTIPSEFTKWGDHWTLSKRSDSHALYHRPGHGDHWEVLGIGVRAEPYTWPSGKITPPGEFLRMGDSDYGVCSWCFMDQDSAETRFREATAATEDVIETVSESTTQRSSENITVKTSTNIAPIQGNCWAITR